MLSSIAAMLLGHAIPALDREQASLHKYGRSISYQRITTFVRNRYRVQHKLASTTFTYQIFLKFQVSEKYILCFIFFAAALISGPHYICKAQALYFARNIWAAWKQPIKSLWSGKKTPLFLLNLKREDTYTRTLKATQERAGYILKTFNCFLLF